MKQRPSNNVPTRRLHVHFIAPSYFAFLIPKESALLAVFPALGLRRGEISLVPPLSAHVSFSIHLAGAWIPKTAITSLHPLKPVAAEHARTVIRYVSECCGHVLEGCLEFFQIFIYPGGGSGVYKLQPPPQLTSRPIWNTCRERKILLPIDRSLW